MIKIGFTDFWPYKENTTDWFEIDDFILRGFREYGVDYLLVDGKEKCMCHEAVLEKRQYLVGVLYQLSTTTFFTERKRQLSETCIF